MNTSDKKWKVLESEYIIRRPWLTARKDKVLLPTGVVNPEFYVLEYPDWVNVIAITKDGMFVMVHQYRHGIGKTSYELCAGVIEDGETPLDAAKRELYEETGFGNGIWEEFMTLSANPSCTNNLTHSFLATDVERISTQHLDKTEDLSVHLFTHQQIKKLLESGELPQALMAAPLWKYLHDNKTP